VETILSRQHPTVRAIRRLARGDGQEGTRVLLEGRRLVDDARAAGVTIPVAFFAASLLDRVDSSCPSLVVALEQTGTRILRVSDSVMDAISPARTP
jgi:hypothetical protein